MLTTRGPLRSRGPPPCCRCGDSGAASRLEATVRKDLATPGFVQWRQTLANRTLALRLPGGRQLFVTTGGALWTQQRAPAEYTIKEKVGNNPMTIPGPFAPPAVMRPRRNITARSYSWTTCTIDHKMFSK